MKKRKELDADSIGEQTRLTKEEEKSISEFIKSRKRPNSKKKPTHKKIAA